MNSELYSQGEAFQVEKRTVFSSAPLPLCAAGQLAGPGDFFSATVGGWGVVAVRDRQGAVRVLRNACRHQNMPVVGAATGTCESLRCRFHGWTYDLQGRFLAAPPPVAPPVAPGDPRSPDLDMAVLPSAIASGLVFFSLAAAVAPLEAGPLAGPLAAYGGTLTTEIACNWKVCVEHLLAGDGATPDFTWAWPLLLVRRAGPAAVIEQVVPHTFLRTRLLTHAFGRAAEDLGPSAAAIKQACETLQTDRAAGMLAAGGGLVDGFHRRLAEAYARDGATT